MSGSPHVVYRPRSDVDPEQGRTLRAAALRYAFDCHAKKKAAEAQDGDVEADSFVERHACESGRANHRNGGGSF